LSRSAALVAAALVIVAAVLLVILREEGDPPKQAAADAPNVIVIMTDDQALNTWSADVMPRTFERFEGGTDFTQGFAVPPLCCPARATLMTGRYPQNHGVVTNRYNSLEDKDDVLPVWLSDAGYKTMIAGKFLNGYEKAKETNNGVEPAPGWDRWRIPRPTRPRAMRIRSAGRRDRSLCLRTSARPRTRSCQPTPASTRRT